uniref:Ig-like domain-containing protein n=1 Tax=Glossina austeni TaxID=7395 RepID=A0A1A9USN5_GLOAU
MSTNYYMLFNAQITTVPLLAQPQAVFLIILILMCRQYNFHAIETAADVLTDPKFTFPIANVTASVGREAFLPCVVQDLGSYKVAWLRVDTQTILTIQNHVITKNVRIGITNSEHKTWTMRIKDIKESDKGWYMCQINTDPMKSQMGYLDVVVPPDILDYPTSTDMVVREGSNVTLKCAATGSPEPTIIWRRENGVSIELANTTEGKKRIKSSELYQQSKITANSVDGEENENPGKRKDLMMFNEIENLYNSKTTTIGIYNVRTCQLQRYLVLLTTVLLCYMINRSYQLQ